MMVSNNTLILIIAALVALALLAFVIMRRGQRVDLGRPDDAPIASTLERFRPEPAPAAPPPVMPGDGDNLALLKGVGPRLITQLHSLGITRFDQLGQLDDAGVAALDAKLTGFTGRIVRDNWVEQARFLASGDIASFEAKYGKLDSGAK